MISLSKKEREKFAIYCKQIAETNDAMAKQIERSVQGPMGKQMAKMERLRAIAYATVSKDLLSSEEQTI